MLEMQRSINALTHEELRGGWAFASQRQLQQEQQTRYLASANSGSLVDMLYTHHEQGDPLLWTTDSTIHALSSALVASDLDTHSKPAGQPLANTVAAAQSSEWHTGQAAYCTWQENTEEGGSSPLPAVQPQARNGHSLEHLLATAVDTTAAEPTALRPRDPSDRPPISILEALYQGSLATDAASPQLQSTTSLTLSSGPDVGQGTSAEKLMRVGGVVEGASQKAPLALRPRRSSMVPRHAHGRWTAPDSGQTGAPPVVLDSHARSLMTWDALGLATASGRFHSPMRSVFQNGSVSGWPPSNVGAPPYGPPNLTGGPLSIQQQQQQQEAYRPGAHVRRARGSISEYPRYNMALGKGRVAGPGETGQTAPRARTSPQAARTPSLGHSGGGWVGEVEAATGDLPMASGLPLHLEQLQPWPDSSCSNAVRQSGLSLPSPSLSGREPSPERGDTSRGTFRAASHRAASAAQSELGSFAPHRQPTRRVGFSSPNAYVPDAFPTAAVADGLYDGPKTAAAAAAEQAQQQHLQRVLNLSPPSPLNQSCNPAQHHFGLPETRPPVFLHSSVQIRQVPQGVFDFPSENLLMSSAYQQKLRQYGPLKPSLSAKHFTSSASAPFQQLSSSTFSSAPLHVERSAGLRHASPRVPSGQGMGPRGGSTNGAWREMADYPVMPSSNEFPGPWPQEQDLWRGSSSGAFPRPRESVSGGLGFQSAYDSQSGVSVGRSSQRQGFVGMLDAAAAAAHASAQRGSQTGVQARRGAAQCPPMMPEAVTQGFPSPFLRQNAQTLLDDGRSGGYGAVYGDLQHPLERALQPVAVRHPLDRCMLGGACVVMLLNIGLVIYAVIALQAMKLDVKG